MPGRRRRAELRRQRQDAARRTFRRTSGFSRRPATPAARSARRSPPIIGFSASRARSTAHLDAMQGAYLGPEFAHDEIEERLTAAGAEFDDARRCEQTDRRRPREALADGQAVGWFQGRMEFGPRALGARSILGDPRSPDDAEDAQLKVKYREVVPALRAGGAARGRRPTGSSSMTDSPYMLMVADVGERRRRAMTRRGAGAVRHRQAERAALGHSGGDPCRLLGAHPDRARGDQSALPRAALARSRRRPAARCWSIPASTCAASRSCARPRTRSAASWAPRSRCWWSATASCARKTQDPALKLDYKNAFELD